MAVSEAVQAALYAKPRATEAYFGDERDADDRVALLKGDGRRNVRKTRVLDYARPDGTKVYFWKVRYNV